MTHLTKYLGLILTVSLILFARENPSSEKMKNNKITLKKNDHGSMYLDSIMTDAESIVREGVIDLTAIDKNKNGKVFQDQMCWNVISDSPGECPQCGMTLKEVTVKKAKDNLEKFGFKAK